MYALSIFIHYPSYTHRIPNAGPGLIFGEGLYSEGYFGLVYTGPMFGWLVFWGGLYFGFCST